MFLAWVEVRATKPHLDGDRATSLGTDSPSSTTFSSGGAADARPLRVAPCDLVEKEFPGLRAARAWASEQLTQRPDVTGNVAVFETDGPLVRLAWRPGPAPTRARRPRTAKD